jgi:hypothetical protein
LRKLSWNDTATTQAIVDFVETAARDLPPEERVAVFDNDGALVREADADRARLHLAAVVAMARGARSRRWLRPPKANPRSSWLSDDDAATDASTAMEDSP